MIYVKAIAHTRNTKKSAANLTILSIPKHKYYLTPGMMSPSEATRSMETLLVNNQVRSP
ncbi:MAG: hypothetical protein V7K97_27620 [Nostoc sp.]|uniref:hypothetical protein n=1 Tax=Nostoc sp. TaxID=1180 RepID=UPI002FFA4072